MKKVFVRGFVFTFLVVFVFQRCSTEIQKDDDVLSKNYVQSFILSDSVAFAINASQNNLNVIFIGEIIESDSGEHFYSLVKHFGDTTFNKPVPSMFEIAVADEFISVDLISDQDFGTSYPAGNSLKNIVKFHGISLYKYITSKYIDEFNWDNSIPEGFDVFQLHPLLNSYHPVYKLLSELTPNDLKLLGQLFNLSFTVKPPQGEHNLTLILKTATKEIKTTQKVVFN